MDDIAWKIRCTDGFMRCTVLCDCDQHTNAIDAIDLLYWMLVLVLVLFHSQSLLNWSPPT